MKDNVRLSSISAVFALTFIAVALAAFVGSWVYHSVQMKRISAEEVRLRQEQSELTRFRNWMNDYARIYFALDILSKNRLTQEQKEKLSDEIWMISRNYSIDPLLIPAIVFQESKGNPKAKGRFRSGVESGAYGLMQLKVPTAQAIGKRFGIVVEDAEDLMRPEVNVVVGSAYLIRLMGRYGNVKLAIIAYNMGQGGVDAKIRERAPVPTFYYEEVLEKYRKLKRLVDERIGEIP